MKRDDDPALWDLLGHSSDPRISPFFARNVLREIRKPSGWRGFHDWFELPRLISAAGTATILLTVLFLRWSVLGPSTDHPLNEMATSEPLEYEVIADVEELLAVDDNSLDENALL